MRVALAQPGGEPRLSLLRVGREAAAHPVEDPAGEKNARTDGRRIVGDLVGQVFYGTLLRQMQAAGLKGKYMHGGRGEEVLQGQLTQELARRMGESPNDALSNAVFDMISSRPKYRGAMGVAEAVKGAA